MMISYDSIKSGEAMVPVAKADGLALALIQIDGGTQSRATLNQHVVDDYAEAIKAGAAFPPIVVFYDGKKHWLADGFHRFHAYQKAGKAKVAADIRQGTRRDAILFSVGANETHGLRRTRDDKRRAVLTLLNDAEWSAKPERWIATTANVSHTYVQKIRAEHLATLPDRPSQVEVERGGKTYTMQTASIGAKPVSKENLATEGTTPEPIIFKASEPETAPEVTAPEGEDLDAIRAGHITQYHVMQLRGAWSKANDEARAIFLAEFNLDFIAAPVVAAEATGTDLREPVAAEQGQIIREGDAPRETDRFGGDASCPDTEFPSAANPVEPEAVSPVPPAASGTISPSSGIQGVTGGNPSEPSPDAGAEDVSAPAERKNAQSEQAAHHFDDDVPAFLKQERAERQPNPKCQKPGNCKWDHGQVSCWRCNSAPAARESEVA